MQILFTANRCGWKDSFTATARLQIARAMYLQYAYDIGYKHELTTSPLPVWEAAISNAINTGHTSKKSSSPSHAETNTYRSNITATHPEYITELFRYAQQVKVAMDNISILADTMNFKGAVPGETRLTLSLYYGTKYCSKEKPSDTPEYKTERT